MKLASLFAASILALTLPGCKLLQSASGPTYVADAVDAAVIGAELGGVQAAQINRIAKAALSVDSGASASMSVIQSVITAQFAKLNLPAADQAAAGALATALGLAIQSQISKNASVAQAEAAIATVLQDVITATGG
jgi:hypothetical protein